MDSLFYALTFMNESGILIWVILTSWCIEFIVAAERMTRYRNVYVDHKGAS